ncbi:MAG TPA: ShlB/FhaC/HecB family hemolysin secretion/activation protein [Burkholderiaceae bacterium]|jgi:hemolysin activation/secretion protein
MRHPNRHHPSSSLLALVPGVLALGLGGTSWAQTPPDAGTQRQQAEREHPLVLPGKQPPLRGDVTAPVARPGGTSVQVRSFHFSGNSQLSDAQLQRTVHDFVGRTLDVAGLQTAAAAVSKAYRDAGRVARVVLPQQTVAQGVVEIQIIEARMGKVLIDGADPKRVPTSLILATAGGSQVQGQPLDRDGLARGVMLADDLPGVTIAGSLRRGQGPDETDLVLSVKDQPLFVGDAWVDNAGSRSTGELRAAARLTAESPLHQGDRFDALAIASEGSKYLRTDFSLPVGARGARLGVNASALKYRAVTSDFSALAINGKSSGVGLDFGYPLLRTRSRNLFLSAELDSVNFLNRAQGEVSSDYNVQSASLGLNGNLFDEIGGGGVNTASVSWISSTVDLSHSPSAARDALTTRTNGHSNRLRYSLSRQQALPGPWGDALSFYAAYRGQWASKNQDSSNRFSLGGPAGVRAYPVDEGGGSKGQVLNLELRARLPHSLVLTGFADWGHVVVNADNAFASANPAAGSALPNAYSLKGAGLELAAALPHNGNLHLTWAHRIGSNPNPTATGNDQDGSKVKNRLWLSLDYGF